MHFIGIDFSFQSTDLRNGFSLTWQNYTAEFSLTLLGKLGVNSYKSKKLESYPV